MGFESLRAFMGILEGCCRVPCLGLILGVGFRGLEVAADDAAGAHF